jgi:hypothetical protein
MVKSAGIIRRRSFFSGGGALALAAAASFSAWPRCAHALSGLTGRTAVLGEAEALRAVAAAYHREHDDRTAVLRLYEAYARLPASTRDGALLRWFARNRAADLAAGRVVLLSGWMIARSEARLCAVLALASERQ